MRLAEILEEIDGVLFDAVGTLIEPTPPVAEVYRAAAEARGLSIESDAMRGRFRSAFRETERADSLGALATDEARERSRWRRIVDGCLAELPDRSASFDALWDHFGRPSAWRAFPDVGPTLRTLRDAGLAIRIGSNFDGRLRPVLRGLPELAPWADDVLISSEVGVRKPHPEFFRAACESLGLPPGRVLCVGDDEANDLEGARAAGLRAVLLDRDGRGRGIRSLAELLAPTGMISG